MKKKENKLKKNLSLALFGLMVLVLTIVFSYSCQALAERNGPRNEDGKIVNPGDKRGQGQQEKVFLCHVPGEGESNTLEISGSAVESHLSNHEGDYLGECEQEDLPEDPVEELDAGTDETDEGVEKTLDSGSDDSQNEEGSSEENGDLHIELGELELLVTSGEVEVKEAGRKVSRPSIESVPVGCTCDNINLASLALFGIPFVMIRRRKNG